MDRLVVYRDAHGDWRWRYDASNGRILADSAEGYRRRTAAMRQAARVSGRKVTWAEPTDTGQVIGHFR